MMTDPILGWAEEQHRNGLLPTTIRRRTGQIRYFRRYLDRDLFTATRSDVIGWLDSTPKSAKTRTGLLSTLGCFYRWAITEGMTDSDPTDRIVRPRVRRYLPRPMPGNDLEIALAAATPVMRAWLLLGCLTGLRCMEIANLDRQDVLDTQEPAALIVRGKGEKERIVPLHPIVLLALQEAGSARSGPLFRSYRKRDNGRYTASYVSQTINAHLHGLGIAATAHSLRHRFATDIYRVSRDLRMTQELLGHASVATTAVYAAWSPKESAQVVAKLEPPAPPLPPGFRQKRNDVTERR